MITIHGNYSGEGNARQCEIIKMISDSINSSKQGYEEKRFRNVCLKRYSAGWINISLCIYLVAANCRLPPEMC